MYYRLNGTIIYLSENIIVYGHKSLSIKARVNFSEIKHFLEQIKEGLNADKIDVYVNCSIVGNIVKKMFEMSLIIPYKLAYLNTPLERSYDFLCHHLSGKQTDIDFNHNINITIFGCGGVGANIALNLLVMGFSNFTFVDYDTVEASNLNRQFPFVPEDIGKNKAQALKDNLLKRNPSAKIMCLNLFINSTQILIDNLSTSDLIVSAIDSPPIKSAIYSTEYALEKNIPIIFGAAGYDTIKVGPLLKSKGAMKNYLSYLNSVSIINATPIRGSIPSTNSLLTSILSNEIFNLFYDEKKMLFPNKKLIMNHFSLEIVEENDYEN
ncbi:ThiF family adenylyltransferase [Fluviispira vulneris]|uniref:ThiF family adenylyltransferase n=1 Tax=Fluviispira vulneris TaxID=2763012 RepID=UPI001644E9B6|nr:ThiF family adenylyltransferase [Fluviispira vulneris]